MERALQEREQYKRGDSRPYDTSLLCHKCTDQGTQSHLPGASCFSVSFWQRDDHAQSMYFVYLAVCFGIGEKKHRASAWTLRWKAWSEAASWNAVGLLTGFLFSEEKIYLTLNASLIIYISNKPLNLANNVRKINNINLVNIFFYEGKVLFVI